MQLGWVMLVTGFLIYKKFLLHLSMRLHTGKPKSSYPTAGNILYPFMRIQEKSYQIPTVSLI